METEKELTIAKIVKRLPRIKENNEIISNFEEKNPFTPKYSLVDKATYLGIEVEVENVRSYKNTNPMWSIKDDGSLRNNGREFVTPPIRAWRVEHALTDLLTSQLNPDIDFSERTSIHVHMNIRTLTPKQLETFLLTYLMFEKVIFNWVGKTREQNIFCNPIYSTSDLHDFSTIFQDFNPYHFNWNKYTALNLEPIKNFGTVEFRHLYGTSDIKTIMTWINIILSLKRFALRAAPGYIKEEILSINTTSTYRTLACSVFGTTLADMLCSYEQFKEDCYFCITYIKETYKHSAFKRQLLSSRFPFFSDNQTEDTIVTGKQIGRAHV